MPPKQKPLLSLSLDADNLWSYMKTHGDPGWETFPTYLPTLAEHVLPLLNKQGLKITFFLVGRDAKDERNKEALRALAQAGHEIGNHSYEHEPWLHEYSREQCEEEIATAEEAILEATGHRTRGFRGPGFSLSPNILGTLQKRGYQYDASTFPTILGPIARLYYLHKSKDLPKEERKKRGRLFGRFRDGIRPLKPYRWELPEANSGTSTLVEIPVTTMPLFRVPIHLSYVLYLAAKSRPLARLYFKNSLRLCKLLGVEPSILLHPLDLLGGDLVKGLEFFPGMNKDTAWKTALFEEFLTFLKKKFEIVCMQDHAKAILERSKAERAHPLPLLRPEGLQ